MSDTTTTDAAADTDATTAAPTDATGTTDATQGDPADLGDAGKKALKAERDRATKAERTATDLRKQLDAINQANESAVEKAQREANEAKEAATKATADALRFRIAAKHGIAEDDADLFLTGTDAETLERQAARLVERTPTTAGAPRPDLTQGGKGGVTATDPAAAFAEFIKQQRSA